MGYALEMDVRVKIYIMSDTEIDRVICFFSQEKAFLVCMVQSLIAKYAVNFSAVLTYDVTACVGLKPGGLFVLKENIARTGFVLDKEDKSITRSDSYFKELFNQCGLYIYKMKDQKDFPDELFAVKMYALTTEMPRQGNRPRPKRTTNRPAIIR
ncbi:hypothetical protein HAX54_053256 [Datura stramonium]|uniref:Alpha N-terminal protein methyltransferase 1 n=1 Tax=Datura stramonium TaxID=4076 RepID=A0ABS8T124_DATST|nr:hypothetical protein [Datura stramonium]